MKYLKRILLILFFYLVLMLNLIPVCKSFLFPVAREVLIYRSSPHEFSKEVWDEKPYRRGNMANDLLARYDFLSMTKDEVIELLGTKRLDIGEKTLRYETGGGFLHDEILMFIYDENGKITDVGLSN